MTQVMMSVKTNHIEKDHTDDDSSEDVVILENPPIEIITVSDEEQDMSHVEKVQRPQHRSNKNKTTKPRNCIKYVEQPMNDKSGEYYIDQDTVAIYQEGLKVHDWNPTQVLYEICSRCNWNRPEFKRLNCKDDTSFLYSVKVKSVHYKAFTTGKTKKLAKHFASTRFLKWVGFNFEHTPIGRKDGASKSPTRSRSRSNRRSRSRCREKRRRRSGDVDHRDVHYKNTRDWGYHRRTADDALSRNKSSRSNSRPRRHIIRDGVHRYDTNFNIKHITSLNMSFNTCHNMNHNTSMIPHMSNVGLLELYRRDPRGETYYFVPNTSIPSMCVMRDQQFISTLLNYLQ